MKRIEVLLPALLVVVAIAGLTGCRSGTSGFVRGTGTVVSYGGECTGLWILRADDGRTYELRALAADFQAQGLRVRFVLKPVADHVSGCMVGPGADVVSIRKL
jgi:hypothetical protein